MGEATIDSTGKPVGAKSKKSAKKEEPKDTIWSRRDFFSLAGWAGFAATLGFSTLFFTRLLFPRVLFEPSPIFKAGRPSDYTVGDVSTKYVKDQRVWIVRDLEGIYVVYALCTHLGCTPRWVKQMLSTNAPAMVAGLLRRE